MERTIVNEIGTGNIDGKAYIKKKILLVNDDNTNYIKKAQSYFTKEQKKVAKIEHKCYNA